MSYRHLSIEEREKIVIYLAGGWSICKIAEELGRSKSTISRENICQAKPKPATANDVRSADHTSYLKILYSSTSSRRCFLTCTGLQTGRLSDTAELQDDISGNLCRHKNAQRAIAER